MTKKTAVLLGIILVTFCQTLFCQVERDYHLDKDNMSFFKEAELVVEGRFLKPLHAYAAKDADGKEHYYGICPVIAYRVFKGDAKPGDTIYVTREGTSLEEAIASPYDESLQRKEGFDSLTGRYYVVEYDVLYGTPLISQLYQLHVIDHFHNNCILFFKASLFPMTQDDQYSSLKQYQYMYPYVFYDEGTKLYVSGNRFAGLNDTIFNSRQELYDFMRTVGGYDTTVIGNGTPKNLTNPNESHHKVIQYGPPSKVPDNKKWTSYNSNNPILPEVEKRWGKDAKKKSKPRKKQH